MAGERLSGPHQGSMEVLALFLSQDQVENANDEAKAEADPGQDEAIAVVALEESSSITIRIMMSVDGRPDHNAKPAHQHGGPREEEAVSLLHGEELEHEDHEGDDGEDDGKDHEGLHCLERIFIGI